MHMEPLHRNNLQTDQRDQKKLPALFEICRHKLSISTISAWTVECMSLRFWLIYELCSWYSRFSLHFKSLWALVRFYKSIVHRSILSRWDVFSFIIYILWLIQILRKTDHFLKSTIWMIHPLWISKNVLKQGVWRH